ncbi:sugar phosphate isomerase/epimerase family protein [Brachybacterium alimentarium]|uniref:sugar phosphate isomerase/epimerase family protein n=1 Tax=Brachybacterium alimentarium TaxID=47845 RepID=UPI003FD29BE2
MARIGIQLMMLKEHIAREGVLAVLRRVVDTGFTVIEISQIPMTEENVADFETARAELGIEVAAISAKTSVPAGSEEYSLESDLELHVEHARRLGTSMIRIGMMPQAAMTSPEAFGSFCHEVEQYALLLDEAGISLSYHNHHIEFARANGTMLLDRLRREAPHLRFEIDCHWVQRGGRDPERTLADFAGVLDLVHLKDFRIALPSAELLMQRAAGDIDAWAAYWQGGIHEFAEVGAGTIDWVPVIDQSIKSGARYLLIEQDRTYGRDIFDCLADSRSHLVSLGYQDLIQG